MKKIDFLNKLKEEEKLGLVDPSEEIKQSYTEKSESNLISAKILLNNNCLEESTSLSYYSMYHILTALLFRVGIKCENHTASIILLKEIFDIGYSDIQFAKKERLDKQYYTNFSIVEKDTEDMIKKAEEFNKKILDFIAKLNHSKIRAYREKFKLVLCR